MTLSATHYLELGNIITVSCTSHFLSTKVELVVGHYKTLTSLFSTLLHDVYTIDHEVIPRPCEVCDWMLYSPWDDSSLHQGKKCESDHGVPSPQKTYFKAYVIH